MARLRLPRGATKQVGGSRVMGSRNVCEKGQNGVFGRCANLIDMVIHNFTEFQLRARILHHGIWSVSPATLVTQSVCYS